MAVTPEQANGAGDVLTDEATRAALKALDPRYYNQYYMLPSRISHTDIPFGATSSSPGMTDIYHGSRTSTGYGLPPVSQVGFETGPTEARILSGNAPYVYATTEPDISQMLAEREGRAGTVIKGQLPTESLRGAISTVPGAFGGDPRYPGYKPETEAFIRSRGFDPRMPETELLLTPEEANKAFGFTEGTAKAEPRARVGFLDLGQTARQQVAGARVPLYDALMSSLPRGKDPLTNILGVEKEYIGGLKDFLPGIKQKAITAAGKLARFAGPASIPLDLIAANQYFGKDQPARGVAALASTVFPPAILAELGLSAGASIQDAARQAGEYLTSPDQEIRAEDRTLTNQMADYIAARDNNMAVTPAQATATTDALAGQVPVGGPLLPEQPFVRGSLGGPVVGPDTGGYSRTYLDRYGGTVPGAWDAQFRRDAPTHLFESGNFDLGSIEALKAHPIGWNRPDQGGYTGVSYYDTYRGGGDLPPEFEIPGKLPGYLGRIVAPRIIQQLSGIPATDGTRSSAILDALATRAEYDPPTEDIEAGLMMGRLANQGLISEEQGQRFSDVYGNVRGENLDVQYTDSFPTQATITEELSEFPSWVPFFGGDPIGSIEGTVLPSVPVTPQTLPVNQMASDVQQALAAAKPRPRGMPSPAVTPQLQALTELAQTDPTIAARYTTPGSQDLIDIATQQESFANIPETPWTPPAPVIPDIVVPPPAAAPEPYVEQFEAPPPKPAPRRVKYTPPKKVVKKKAKKVKPGPKKAKKAKVSKTAVQKAVVPKTKYTPPKLVGRHPTAPKVTPVRRRKGGKPKVRRVSKAPRRPGGR